MNKFLLKLTALMLVFVGVASTCSRECPPDCPPPPPPEIEYPINIPFTEYSLLDTDCQWVNLPNDETVMIINSKEELENYISCTEGSYPAIDFRKYSILLLSGETNHAFSDVIVKELKQLSPNKINMDIEIGFYENTIMGTWSNALVVKKIGSEINFDLNVAFSPVLYKPCNCIVDTLTGEWSWFKRYGGFGGTTTPNEFKSIVKIFGQNKDEYVYYEVFVEDTLFSYGSFKIDSWSHYRIAIINLPHKSPMGKNEWAIIFGMPLVGIPLDNNTLWFWDIAVDGYDYYYQRIR